MDWREQLQPGFRHRIINKIMDVLKKHLPISVPEELIELQKIAVRFEERIYTVATSQSDYLRKISLKMLSLDIKTLQTPPITLSVPNTSLVNQNPMDPGDLFDQMPLRSSKKSCSKDMLSDLPNTLLHHILSFLPAQEIVRTSVLSSRWQHLWTSAPCLDIDIDEFDRDKEKFCMFIDRLLLLHEAAPLDKFHLHSLDID